MVNILHFVCAFKSRETCLHMHTRKREIVYIHVDDIMLRWDISRKLQNLRPTTIACYCCSLLNPYLHTPSSQSEQTLQALEVSDTNA